MTDIKALVDRLVATETFLRSLASRLHAWANESREYGWSTHQVAANLSASKECHEMADVLSVALSSTVPAQPSREQLEDKIAQAYQVIGQLLDRTGDFEEDYGQRVLDYFAGNTFDEEFLPWPKPDEWKAPSQPLPIGKQQ